MTTPPKYEDVVAKLEASNKLCDSLERSMKNHRHELGLSMGREAALREELERRTADLLECGTRRKALQQRLTFAEQREAELEGLLHEVANLDPRGEFLGWQLDGKIDAALKPAAEPHKCIECESQYCHGVCVERGDDDECYKGAEGEGS